MYTTLREHSPLYTSCCLPFLTLLNVFLSMRSSNSACVNSVCKWLKCIHVRSGCARSINYPEISTSNSHASGLLFHRQHCEPPLLIWSPFANLLLVSPASSTLLPEGRKKNKMLTLLLQNHNWKDLVKKFLVGELPYKKLSKNHLFRISYAFSALVYMIFLRMTRRIVKPKSWHHHTNQTARSPQDLETHKRTEKNGH
jgi:hypothetical protein